MLWRRSIDVEDTPRTHTLFAMPKLTRDEADRHVSRTGYVPTPIAPTTAGGVYLGPWSWTVTWGSLLRPGFAAERVTAWDADEALVIAAEMHPELPRPRVALLAQHAA
jgi:hypothetical protein